MGILSNTPETNQFVPLSDILLPLPLSLSLCCSIDLDPHYTYTTIPKLQSTTLTKQFHSLLPSIIFTGLNWILDTCCKYHLTCKQLLQPLDPSTYPLYLVTLNKLADNNKQFPKSICLEFIHIPNSSSFISLLASFLSRVNCLSISLFILCCNFSSSLTKQDISFRQRYQSAAFISPREPEGTQN